MNTFLALVSVCGLATFAHASEIDGPYNSPLRAQCLELAVSTALRTHQIHRSYNGDGFILVPFADLTGVIMNGYYICSTSCETYVREMVEGGRAHRPQVRCSLRPGVPANWWKVMDPS